MSKITVFWIEDNPIIKNEETINGLKYPKFLHTKTFDYLLFQHPKQVEEYLSMISEAEAGSGTASLAEKCPEALPDIIVFDYKLFDAFSRNNNSLQYANESHYAFLKEKSATHWLKKTFDNLFKTRILFLDTEDVKNGRYMGDKFKSEFKADTIQADDEFGLYCGITMIREFKEYITVGVPATINKVDKTTMSYNSLFYEWINSYDLKGAIERPAKEEEMKDWAKILEFSAVLLRKRIETQIQTGKAIPSYSQLSALAEGIIPNERVFSFETIYGKRNLPLEGLFIDVIDKSEQNATIAEWATGVLNKLPVTNTIIKKADKATTKLWEAYIEFFEDRIVLSDYSVRLGSLNTTESSYLVEVKKRLGVNSTTGLIANECSIQTLLEKEKGDDKKSVIRLTFLLAITQASIKLEKQKQESNFDATYFALTDEEYLNILYPKANFKTPFLLSMNIDKDKSGHIEAQTKWLFSNLTIPESKVTTKTLFQISEWILKGEKEILKSFFYEDSDYYPQWLRS